MHSVWALLGIEQTKDLRAIKRAYAALLKAHHPEDDPEGFRRLNHAYQAAIEYAQAGTRVEVSMPAPPVTLQRRPDFEPPPRASPPSPLPLPPPPESRRLPLRPIEPDAEREQPPLSAPEAEAPRHDPAEDARELIGMLQRQGDAAAVAKLEEILARPVYRSIATKEEFQKAVLLGLPWQGVLPTALLSVLAERFGWHEPRHPFARAFPAQFQGIRRARDQHLARRMLEDFAYGKLKQYAWQHRANYRRAARMLLGRRSRFFYRSFASDRFLRDCVSLILKRIHQSYPLASDTVFDPAALAWCRGYLISPTVQFKSINRVLMALNFVTGMVTAVVLETGWTGRGRLMQYPNLDIAVRLVIGFAFVALPLYALEMNLIPVWDDFAKTRLTPKRRFMAFRLAALLLYLLVSLFLTNPAGLYLWGLVIALFALRMPNLMQLAATLFVSGIGWILLHAASGPPGFQTTQGYSWLQLDNPLVCWLFAIVLIPLHRKLAARGWWWSNFQGYMALLIASLFALSVGGALLVSVY